MIFSVFQKNWVFRLFLVHPTVVSVLLSASVERCFVSRMRDFSKHRPSGICLKYDWILLNMTGFVLNMTKPTHLWHKRAATVIDVNKWIGHLCIIENLKRVNILYDSLIWSNKMVLVKEKSHKYFQNKVFILKKFHSLLL